MIKKKCDDCGWIEDADHSGQCESCGVEEKWVVTCDKHPTIFSRHDWCSQATPDCPVCEVEHEIEEYGRKKRDWKIKRRELEDKIDENYE